MLHDLTPTERRVLTLMIRELNEQEIAGRLTVARSTVKKHRQNLYHKTGTNNPVALVGWGRRHFRRERRDIERLLDPDATPDTPEE